MSDIEYHADDYGLFPAQSREILDCCQGGRLNAVSIMPNSPYVAECMEMLRPYREKIRIAVHLNFLEGHSLCQGNLLTDENGVFRCSFGRLLLADLLPGRKELRRQLRSEISAQIHAVLSLVEPAAPLRIDGHAHYHMLPAVFDSLMMIIEEEKLEVEYIRFPRERLSLYFQSARILKEIRPINIVKVVILNLLTARNRKKCKKHLSSLEDRLFLGVALSGNMTAKNVSAILPRAIRKAKKKGIEILAHPGGVYNAEDISRLTHTDDVKFLTSEARKKEKEMFRIRRDD